MNPMDNELSTKLIVTCGQKPEVYNRISRRLYSEFGIQGAEICLLVTYFVLEEGEKGAKD